MPPRILVATLVATAALPGTAVLAADQPSSAEEALTTSFTTSFPSAALRSRLHFLVHLPAGYATSNQRYPVVYFLHGLPAGPTSYQSVSWVAAALDRTGLPAILIVPQGTQTTNGDPEYHDWGPGRNWETALAVELPRYVDAHFRTIRSRSGRAIIGVSAGGYGATILGLHHAATFEAIESWSGYFQPTDPTGQETLDVGTNSENAEASVHMLVPGLAGQLKSYPTLLAFYVGSGDPTFVPDNAQLNRELTAAGIPHLFELYPGVHTVSLWEKHATAWLALALHRLSAPEPAQP
jgi:enterochelin esterase-like enzyme